MGTVTDMALFRRRAKAPEDMDFQSLLRQAVDLSRLEKSVLVDGLHIVSEGGEVRWMHRKIADHLIARHAVAPPVIICLPYAVGLLSQAARVGISLDEDDAALALAQCEDVQGSFHLLADQIFLWYALGPKKHHAYLEYLAGIGQNAYCQWASGRYRHMGALMAEAFRPLGDAVRAEVASRLHLG